MYSDILRDTPLVFNFSYDCKRDDEKECTQHCSSERGGLLFCFHCTNLSFNCATVQVEVKRNFWDYSKVIRKSISQECTQVQSEMREKRINTARIRPQKSKGGNDKPYTNIDALFQRLVPKKKEKDENDTFFLGTQPQIVFRPRLEFMCVLSAPVAKKLWRKAQCPTGLSSVALIHYSYRKGSELGQQRAFWSRE